VAIRYDVAVNVKIRGLMTWKRAIEVYARSAHLFLVEVPAHHSLPDLVTSAPSVAVFRSRLCLLFNISYPCDCTVPAQWL